MKLTQIPDYISNFLVKPCIKYPYIVYIYLYMYISILDIYIHKKGIHSMWMEYRVQKQKNQQNPLISVLSSILRLSLSFIKFIIIFSFIVNLTNICTSHPPSSTIVQKYEKVLGVPRLNNIVLKSSSPYDFCVILYNRNFPFEFLTDQKKNYLFQLVSVPFLNLVPGTNIQ